MPDFDSYVEFGSAVARYAPMVEDFGRLLWWERLPIILNGVYSFASKLRLHPVADLIGAVLVGQRRGFERQVQHAAEVRMLENAKAVLGESEPRRNEAILGILLAVISLDPTVTEEMRELQRLPVGLFAVQARMFALDNAADRHWRAALAVAERADMHAIGAMVALCEAGVTFTADALPITQRALLRRLSKDAVLCAVLANSAGQDGAFIDVIDEAVEAHLPEFIWSGICRNGQPIPEDERAAISSQIFGGIKSNG